MCRCDAAKYEESGRRHDSLRRRASCTYTSFCERFGKSSAYANGVRVYVIEVGKRYVLRPRREEFLDRAKGAIDLQLPIAILRRRFTTGQRKFQPLQVQTPQQCHGLCDRLLIGRRMAGQLAV